MRGWAVMKGDGTVLRSSVPLNPLGTGRTAVGTTGFYQVNFGVDVSACVAVANANLLEGIPGTRSFRTSR